MKAEKVVSAVELREKEKEQTTVMVATKGTIADSRGSNTKMLNHKSDIRGDSTIGFRDFSANFVNDGNLK